VSISDLDTPDQVSASLEIFGSNGALSLGGVDGSHRPGGVECAGRQAAVHHLRRRRRPPTNLTEDDVDIGKYWIVRKFDDDANEIGSNWYIWYGDHYERFQMGTAGPVGPVPIATYTFELVTSAVTSTVKTTKTGDNYHPSILVQINKELIRGPQGEMGDMEDLANWDGSTVASDLDVATFNEQTNKWEPRNLLVPSKGFYTMPEAAFVDVPLAIGTSIPLGTMLLPPQEFDCVPYVQGHMRITGIELDQDPFIIGAEVRLGGMSGQVVARGFGNISTYVFLQPHASTSVTPNDAITPTNGRAVIPAGSTGAAATLYINAFNDGAFGTVPLREARRSTLRHSDPGLMPRAGDAFLNGALPLTHDPLARIDVQKNKPEFDLEAFLQQVEQFVEDFLFPAMVAGTVRSGHRLLQPHRGVEEGH
jgi:hypothetical protein